MTKAAGRAAALCEADAVMTRRAAEIQEHEVALRALIADYFHSRNRADTLRAKTDAAVARLRREADARIAIIQEQADQDMAGFDQRACEAVRRV